MFPFSLDGSALGICFFTSFCFSARDRASSIHEHVKGGIIVTELDELDG